MLKRWAGPVRDLAPLVCFWLAMAAYYTFVVSAGRWTTWPGWTGVYDAQATALLSGHLHLLDPPSRELMALANPWDPANMKFWRWDHSYFQGHLYIYWGLVPAFIAAAVRAIFRVPHVGDHGLVFAFAVVRLIAGTLLIRDVARRAAQPPPRWVVALAMLVFALANPTPHTLARAAVYEAAILGGAAGMLAGLYLADRAMVAAGDRAAAAWLAGASLSFGLAAGSRINLFPAAVMLAAFAGLWRWRQGERHDRRRLAAIGAAALLPAAAVMSGHLLLNQLRFGEWTEFGRRYVMTSPLLSPGLRFFVPDSYAYLVAPPQLSCAFPYLQSRWDSLRPLVPRWLGPAWPADHYGSEPTAGLLIAAPFTLFAVAALALAIARAWRRRSASDRTLPSRPSAWAGWFAVRTNWLWIALAIYVVGSAPLLFLKVATMRYEHDFAAGLLLLAIFGAWRLLATPATAAGRRALAWSYGLLAAATIVAGVLLGFSGYFDHLMRHNPDLYFALRDHLSFCR